MPSVVGQLTKGASFAVLIDADSVGGDGGSNILPDATIDAKYRTETAVFFIGTTDNPVLITAPALPIAMVPKGATLKFARYQCNGTDTPTVTFNIRKHDDDAPFTPGVVIWSSDKTATATTASTTSFNSPTVTARQTLWVDVSNVSGTPKTLFLTLEWEYD